MSIRKILFLFLFCANSVHAWWPFTASQKPFVLMLEAAGNPRQPGRIIEDNFEQSITWSCAQHLKHLLAQRMPEVQVVLNRNEREVIEPLHTANFANKLAVDLVVSINFYQESTIKPRIYFYQFSYGSTSFTPATQNFILYPYDQAYMVSSKKSDAYAQMLKTSLSGSAYMSQFECLGVYKIPFAPLIGITCPAVALEIGLKNKQEWQLYIEPIAQALATLIEQRL